MSEYLSILLPLLDGERAAFEGDTPACRYRPAGAAAGPGAVLLAAMAPAMLRLAGQRADGTVLWMTGPATVRDSISPAITPAAAAAGRPAPPVARLLPARVPHDPGHARTRAARIFASYGQLPPDRAMLNRQAAAGPADVAIAGPQDTVSAQIMAAHPRRGNRLRGRRIRPRCATPAHPRPADVAEHT